MKFRLKTKHYLMSVNHGALLSSGRPWECELLNFLFIVTKPKFLQKKIASQISPKKLLLDMTWNAKEGDHFLRVYREKFTTRDQIGQRTFSQPMQAPKFDHPQG